MIELNLTASGKEQELIKQYLQENVSETLAEKINNGVKITKDNKTLLNKKDLNGFMKFANDEAKKLAEKDANCACVEDKTVFGWAIHYFEEDSIEGNLFNEDGTEYKVAPKMTTAPKVEVKQPPKEEKKQQSLFDFMDLSTTKQEKVEEECEEENDDDSWANEEKEEIIEQEQNLETNKSVDMETGEVIEPKQSDKCSVDKELAELLFTTLNGKLEVK
jgi:hypothetical protein